MLFQLIKKHYKDWEENLQPCPIEFDLEGQTTAGRISLTITPANKNEPKGWNMYLMQDRAVKKDQCTHRHLAYCLT